MPDMSQAMSRRLTLVSIIHWCSPCTGPASILRGYQVSVGDQQATHRSMCCAVQVLCASNAAHDQVDPLAPPEGSTPGERVTFEGCVLLCCCGRSCSGCIPAMRSNKQKTPSSSNHQAIIKQAVLMFVPFLCHSDSTKTGSRRRRS